MVLAAVVVKCNIRAWGLKAELEKCDVRCANCHRRKTAIESGSWRTKLELPAGAAPASHGPQPSALTVELRQPEMVAQAGVDPA